MSIEYYREINSRSDTYANIWIVTMKHTITLAIKSLKDRSFRNWITVFGIVVSIAVIFILLTLSAGLQLAIVEIFEDFGTNRMFIVPAGGAASLGGLNARPFDQSDIDAIAALPYFEEVIPQIYRSATLVTYRGREQYANVIGMPNKNVQLIERQYQFNTNLDSGRYFQENERGVAVIGYNIANDVDFFGREVGERNTIEIKGQRFKVIGIYERVGSAQDDNSIYIPLDDARELFNLTTEVDFADAIAKNGVDLDVAKARVERLLERRKGKDQFSVITPEAILRQFSAILSIVQGILLAIASISLIVGAIGIANTMFTSVLEREKEIGIMKAIGAKNKDILTLFMFESGFIGLVGGVVGVILGILLSLLIGQIAIVAGFAFLKISISIPYILFCLTFSFIVGVLSGFLPSYLGSKKKIVNILRDN
jgi:putative ABC transport system permease protein